MEVVPAAPRAAAPAADATVRVALVSKYVRPKDSYITLHEALRHTGLATGGRVDIRYVDYEDIEPLDTSTLDSADAILVPGGFGNRRDRRKDPGSLPRA